MTELSLATSAVGSSVEQWLPVPGWETTHEVSSAGRVRSKRRLVGKSLRPGRLLTPETRVDGLRVTVQLSKDARRVRRGVGALVLSAFVGQRPDGMECCHNDGNPANNRVENLRWDTHSANVLDSVQHGTHFEAAKTKCVRNHPYDSANTYIRPDGKRFCRACKAIYRTSNPQK